MKKHTLTKEEIQQILNNETVAVHEQFRLQMKNSLFQEMILKIWGALFINTNPNGKANTKNFIDTFNKLMVNNFESNFEINYKMYSQNNQFVISQQSYREAFLAALQVNVEELHNYFELDKKIITPN
jgi:hypothetical protein